MEFDTPVNFFIYFGVFGFPCPPPQKNLNTKIFFLISKLAIGWSKRTTDFQDLEEVTGKYENYFNLDLKFYPKPDCALFAQKPLKES